MFSYLWILFEIDLYGKCFVVIEPKQGSQNRFELKPFHFTDYMIIWMDTTKKIQKCGNYIFIYCFN